MNIWKIFDAVVEIAVVILLASIIFVPLPTLSKYGMPLLLSVIVFGVLLLLRGAYNFVQEIPQRKYGEHQEEPAWLLGFSKKTWKSIGGWMVAIAFFILLLNYSKGDIGTKECPDLVRGNSQSDTVIRYFYSPFCPACWTGERNIQRLIEKYPNIRYENFDSRYCGDEMHNANVRGSPAYQLSNGNSTEVVYDIDFEQVESKLCAIGGCT